MQISKSFTAVGNGGAISVKDKDFVYYSVSGTFVGTVLLQKSLDGGLNWETVATKTAAASAKFQVSHPGGTDAQYRFRCSAYTSGTIVTKVLLASSKAKKIFISAMEGAVGAGMATGWVPNQIGYAQLPQSQSDAEIAFGVSGLKIGTKILGYYPLGRIESAGNAASLTLIPSVVTPTASSIGQDDMPGSPNLTVSASANTLLNESNAFQSADYVTKEGESVYFYITGTTAASTKVELAGVVLFIEEP